MHETPVMPMMGSEYSDEQILALYKKEGDRDLFAHLVRRYERELYSYLRRYMGNAELAEDAFQSTLLQVHLKCEQFDEGRRFRPWLYTIATNQAIDAQRRNKRHRMASLDRATKSNDAVDIGALVNLLEGNEGDPLDHVAELERGQWVQQAISELSEQMRSVINLIYYQGMKYREAADVLEIPVGTVKSRLHAAVMKLHEVWQRTHQKENES